MTGPESVQILETWRKIPGTGTHEFSQTVEGVVVHSEVVGGPIPFEFMKREGTVWVQEDGGGWVQAPNVTLVP